MRRHARGVRRVPRSLSAASPSKAQTLAKKQIRNDPQTDLDVAATAEVVTTMEAAGFGFGKKGASPGKFYNFDELRKRTSNDPDLNTFAPSPD